MNLKNVIVASCQQWQDHPKDPLEKKIRHRVNKTEMSIIIGMAGRVGGGGGGGYSKSSISLHLR